MALTECPECKKQVSEQAATCPQCGFPMGANRTHPSAPAERPPALQPPTGPNLPRIAIIAGALIAGIAAFVFARKMGTEGDSPTTASVEEKSTTSSPTSGRPKIPDDPPPVLAAKAAEVPALEAKLQSDVAYSEIWDPARRTDLLVFLSAVSDFVATLSGELAVMGIAKEAPLKKRKLLDSALNLLAIAARTGRYPAHFDQNVRALLDENHSLPHLGLCGTVSSSREEFDVSALAAWMLKDRPEYLHAMVACRRQKEFGWPSVNSPNLPYIQTERGALERLALVDKLTDAERDRLDELKLPELNLSTVDATELWRAYDANEVAADNEWKGKRVIVTGDVAGISKDFTDAIFIQLRSPNEFMPTTAYVRDTGAQKAATLTKRQKIILTCTCTGKVMGAPVLRDCIIPS